MTARQAPPQAIIEEAEFRRSKASFYYFFTQHWKVQIPKKGPRKPEVRQFQKEVAELLDAPDADQLRLVALKARQIGFTTVVAAFATWSCLFGEDVPWLFVSRGRRKRRRTWPVPHTGTGGCLNGCGTACRSWRPNPPSA